MLSCFWAFLIVIYCGVIFTSIAYAAETKESKKEEKEIEKRKEIEEIKRKEIEETKREEEIKKEIEKRKERIERKKRTKEIIRIIKSHTYTREEYIKLYNYCIHIKNKLYEKIEDTEYFNYVLNQCKIISEQSYYTPNYSDLCYELLMLLWEKGYSVKQIKYEILNK